MQKNLSPTYYRLLTNQSFSLIETTISLLIFSAGIAIVASSYLNLLRAQELSQVSYTALEGFRLGTEKLWRDMKYGSNFASGPNRLTFFDFYCRESALVFNAANGTIEYAKDGVTTTLNDPTLLWTKGFETRLATNANGVTRLATIALQMDVPDRRGGTSTTLALQLSVAPLAAPFPSQPCQ